ncbi:MAG: hypothetical protein ACRC2M_19075 [Planktothrix sp.]
MTTATKTASAIRFILKDYNYWPGSEGDSPLAIKVSATELTNEKLIAIDKSLRRKANEGDASFKLPDPATLNISQRALPSVFRTLIQDAYTYNLTDAINSFNNDGDSALSFLESSVEVMEYLVQLYSAFSALQNPKLWRIMAPGDNAAQVTMIIEGTFVSPAETKVIYATTTLYET